MDIGQATDSGTTPGVGVEYQINYSIGHANVPANLREPTNYCSISLRATSVVEALQQANDQLLGLELRLVTATIYRQEIQLEDGWHYFSRMEGVNPEARTEPGLVAPSPVPQKKRR